MINELDNTKISLSLLSVDNLHARQEVSLQYAHTMFWMAQIYQNLGLFEAMKNCARIGIESIKEYQRISAYIEKNKINCLSKAA